MLDACAIITLLLLAAICFAAGTALRKAADFVEDLQRRRRPSCIVS
jgi:hypothetical protein